MDNNSDTLFWKNSKRNINYFQFRAGFWPEGTCLHDQLYRVAQKTATSYFHHHETQTTCTNGWGIFLEEK
jgi:hypothetical protein